MEILTMEEMQDINGGATYTAKCSYCNRKFSAIYSPLLISKATAKTICEGKLHNHIINAHYGNL